MSAVRRRIGLLAAALALVTVGVLEAYPIDAFLETGIRRLELYRLAQEGEMRWRKLPEGALLPAGAISLARPEEHRDAEGNLELPPADDELSRQLERLLAPEDRPRYGVAVLDYTDPDNPVYAEHNGLYKSNVGSVGKLLVALAVMQELAEAYPDDVEARKRVLRETRVAADEYVEWDSHEVPLFDPESRAVSYRPLRRGDEGNLWEWLDWMMSASSNGAAAIVIQQAMLLDRFGQLYPLPGEQHQAWLDHTDRKTEGEVMLGTLVGAVEANGLDPESLRQGSFFTRTGKSKASGVTSYGTPRELVKLLYALETGNLVDEWSSLELKRLLYMTQRRIRYASHPALHDSAVFFKSGSLYGCKPEPDFVCKKYRGNRINILASVAIIESPAEEPVQRYAVAVISNVLYKNSAVAHQTLAMRIHRLLERRARAAGLVEEAEE